MSIFSAKLIEDATLLLNECRRRKLNVATAESCTGGLIAALLTEIPGSSEIFTAGFITYANEAKRAMIGVDKKLIEQHGAVSREVAVAMAEGALKTAKVDLVVAVTGIAGPTGGTPSKPVGLVHIAAAAKNKTTLQHIHNFSGDRSVIRMAAVEAALRLLSKQFDV
jgi:nicotinamide-nucleotide amidase